jgi:DNA-binding LytR/AlgR family response regulator
MKIAIIEDEIPALNRLKKLIGELLNDAEIIGHADSIESAIQLFEGAVKPDLALMDIELADGQSFEIFKHTTVPCPVIFITAYDEFAIKAFKVNAIDYLLKPIDATELKQAIDKYKSQTKPQPQLFMEEWIQLLKPASEKYKSRFLVKTGNKLISIPIEDILFFVAKDKWVYLHTQAAKYIVDYKMDELTEVLDPSIFFQLNRQIVSHVKAIKQVHTYFNGKLKVDLQNYQDEEVIVSRERSSAFKKWLDR